MYWAATVLAAGPSTGGVRVAWTFAEAASSFLRAWSIATLGTAETTLVPSIQLSTYVSWFRDSLDRASRQMFRQPYRLPTASYRRSQKFSGASQASLGSLSVIGTRAMGDRLTADDATSEGGPVAASSTVEGQVAATSIASSGRFLAPSVLPEGSEVSHAGLPRGPTA